MSTIKVQDIQHTGNANDAISLASDSSVALKHSGSSKLATSSTGVSITGTCTATTFSGSGASLTALPAANITGTLPAIDGSNLTGITSDLVNDTTPQLGGSLDVNSQDIVSTSNGDIELDPNGTGKVVFKGNATKGSGQFVLNCENNSHGIIIKGPPHSAAASYTLTLPNDDGSESQVLKTNGSGVLSWVDQTTDTNTTYSAGSGLSLSGTTFSVDTLNQDTTGTAAIATTVTVADESSDTTCFPLFVTAATGNLAPKSGSNLAFNSSTGVITATGLTLSGDLVVNGTTTTLDSTNTTISDNLLELNSGASSNANDSGIIIERGSTGDNAIFAWDESADKFIVGTTTATASDTGDLTIAAASLVTSTVEDSKGDLRSVPNRNESSAYTLVAADAGKCITADDGVTVPANVFAAGDLVTIINNATSDKTITQGSGLTMRNTGDEGATGNVSVKKYSMSTLLFISTTVCYFSTTNKA
jgi:hypothetical protein